MPVVNPNITSIAQPPESGINNGPSPTICSACGKPTQGPFLRALGAAYHINCFKCWDCGDIVASKFFPIEGPDGNQKPLCERDYFRRLNLVCGKCGMALRGSYITACNKKFHVEHFTCSICPTLFGPQDSYYEHDGEVYCHFHYSTRFATKCPGCSSAILKQFVEINRNMRDECWHPECYMINKFWNVKVSTQKSPSVIPPAPTDGDQTQLHAYQEEEERETPAGLKEKQVKMEQQVYRIWTVLAAFEESSAACISDMLRQVSNGTYLDAIRMAEKFILHVEVLFGAIDDLAWTFAGRGIKGMSHVREARMLCRKTVDLFTLLSRTQETAARRMGMTQELLALVTGLAHYLKILIRIALTGALKLESGEGEGSLGVVYQQQQQRHGTLTRANEASPLTSFLDKLHLLAIEGANPAARRMIKSTNSSTTLIPSTTPYSPSTTKNPGTQRVTYGFQSLAPENAGESPFWNGTSNQAGPSSYSGGGNPPSDLCVLCNMTVEEDCVRLGTYQRWHSHCVLCAHCGKSAAVKVPNQAHEIKVGDESTPNISGNHSTTPVTASGPNLSRRLPARVHEFVYDPDQLRDTSSFGNVPVRILCTEHAHARYRGGFHAVSRLEQYAFLLNVALRRLYFLLKKRGVMQMLPVSSDLSTPTGDPYRNLDRSMKAVHFDRKLSSTTAHLPKRSTVIESPTGKSVHPSPSNAEQQQQILRQYQPQFPSQQQPQERHPQQIIPTTNSPNALVSNELSSKPSTPTSDPYRNLDKIMKSVHLHSEPSSTARLPKPSTVIENPTGQIMHPSASNAEQQQPQRVPQQYQPPLSYEPQQPQQVAAQKYQVQSYEPQQVTQKYQPPLPYQQQQSQGRHRQQVIPPPITPNAQHTSGFVPQFLKRLGIIENPLSRKPKERVIRPPSGQGLPTTVVNNSLGRTSAISRDISARREAELPALPIRNSIDLEEDEPSAPSQSLDLSSVNFDEIPDEDEPEYPTTAKTNHEVYPPGSQIGTAPWILASRKPYAPQRPMDAEFMLHMAGLRRQIDGGSLRSSTSTVLTSRVSWLESRTSLESTAFSECFSIGSLPPEVDFSPTPVFKDEIPKGLMPKIESSLLAAQTLKDSAANNDPHPFQSSHLSSSSSTSTLRQRYTQPPDPTGLVRRGYWNRRGDHLTPDGYLVFPPPRMQYPEELRMYPFENEGYQDHSGLFIAYVKRQELPQSLPKHGNPPERPYESFVTYI